MVKERTVFTTGDVARICQVAPRTVSKWFDSGRLRGYRIPGSQDRRIPRKHLIEFLRQNGMPLGELELMILVVGNGNMVSLADKMSSCNGPERVIERCDSLFEAGIKLSKEGINVVVVDVVANGLQEAVHYIRRIQDSTVILGVREAGVTPTVEGIDEYFTSDEAPELVVMRAYQLSSRRG